MRRASSAFGVRPLWANAINAVGIEPSLMGSPQYRNLHKIAVLRNFYFELVLLDVVNVMMKFVWGGVGKLWCALLVGYAFIHRFRFPDRRAPTYRLCGMLKIDFLV